jgi:hypothetical protein
MIYDLFSNVTLVLFCNSCFSIRCLGSIFRSRAYENHKLVKNDCFKLNKGYEFMIKVNRNTYDR